MTATRGLAVGALVAAVLVVGWLLFFRGGGTEYELRFANAGQLVKGDDVQVGGRRIGSVEVDLADRRQPGRDQDHGRGRASRRCTRARRRSSAPPRSRASPTATSRSRRARTTRRSSTRARVLAHDKTTSIVDLDQLFNTFDPKTRKGLQEFIQGCATSTARQGRAGQRGRASTSTRRWPRRARLVNEVVARPGSRSRASSQTRTRRCGRSPSRRGDLTDLVANANTTAAAIGDENVALRRRSALLPGTLRQANTTFVNLRATLDDLDVARGRVEARDEGPRAFLRDAAPAAARVAPDDPRPAPARAPARAPATT